jgi:hypothetical protein
VGHITSCCGMSGAYYVMLQNVAGHITSCCGMSRGILRHVAECRGGILHHVAECRGAYYVIRNTSVAVMCTCDPETIT